MKTNQSYKTLISLTWVIALLFLISYQRSFAGTDTTKITNQQYELNDPRNPDCPCHKLQKQAEDEFAQQNKSKNQFDDAVSINKEIVNDLGKNKSISNNESGVKSIRVIPATASTKSRHKKKNSWITKAKFKFSKRMHRIKRTTPDYRICFKW